MSVGAESKHERFCCGSMRDREKKKKPAQSGREKKKPELEGS